MAEEHTPKRAERISAEAAAAAAAAATAFGRNFEATAQIKMRGSGRVVVQGEVMELEW